MTTVPPTERDAGGSRSRPEAPATKRDGGWVGNGPPQTTRDTAGDAVRTLFRLPPDLEGRYEITGDLKVGGEAAVLRCRRMQDGLATVLKLYVHHREEIDLAERARLREKLRGADRAHVVELYESGELSGYWWRCRSSSSWAPSSISARGKGCPCLPRWCVRS